MVDQEVLEHRAAEGPADERSRLRLSRCRAPLSPNQMCEKLWTLPPQFVLIGYLPCNIPDGAPEISLELAKGLAGALELMGMGKTLMPDQCELVPTRR